jgi:hypothetical protein
VNADRRFGTWRFTMARSVGAVREFLDALPATPQMNTEKHGRGVTPTM